MVKTVFQHNIKQTIHIYYVIKQYLNMKSSDGNRLENKDR